MKLTRRFLALLLAFSMSLSMVTPAFASETETVTEPVTEEPAVVVEEADVEDIDVEEPVDEEEPEEEEIVVEEVAASEEAAMEELVVPITFGSTFVEVDGEVGVYTKTLTAEAGNLYNYSVSGLCAGMTVQIDEQEAVTIAEGETSYSFAIDNQSSETALEVVVKVTLLQVTENLNPGYFGMIPGGRYYSLSIAPMTATTVILSGAAGMMLQIGADEAYLVEGNSMTPHTFSIENPTAEEITVDLMLTQPVVIGTWDNPDELAEGSNQATVEAGAAGYFFNWEAPDRGTLTIEMANDCTDWFYCVNVVGGTYGDNNYSNDDEPVATYSVPVKKGDVIEVIVNTASNEAGTISFNATFDYAEGTQGNPIKLTAEDFTADETGALNKTVIVGATLEYYYTLAGFAGKELLINYDNGQIIDSENYVFSVDNAFYDWEQEYSLTIQEPAGSEQNPILLWSTEDNIEARILDGKCYYEYTVDTAGTLEFRIADGEVTITNVAAGKIWAAVDANDEGVIEVPVEVGDELEIVITSSEESLVWSFDYPQGTELNPIDLSNEWIWNDAWTEATATVTVPADATYYFESYGIGGMAMTIGTGEPTIMSGNPRTAVGFTITNPDTENPASYVLKITYPAGTMNNPAELAMGSNKAAVPGNGTPYLYSWNAPADGILTVTMDESCTNWTFAINNMTAGTYGDTHFSVVEEGEELISTETVEVSMGDEIQIVIGTENFLPGEVPFTANFYEPGQVDSYPIIIMENMMSAELNAGETLYFRGRIGGKEVVISGAAGLTMTMNGEDYTPDETGVISLFVAKPQPGNMSFDFSIKNGNETAASVTMEFKTPLGDMENPEELTLGEKSLTQPAGFGEYFYTWTAPRDGEFTFTMITENGALAETGWQYTLDNLTKGTYGDTQWSDSDPLQTETTLVVSEGDVIQLKVCTYDPENPSTTPAGTVWFTTKFAAYGSAELPLWPDWNWDENYVEATATIKVLPGETFYFNLANPGTMLTVDGGAAKPVTGNGRNPQTESVTNDSEETKTYSLKLYYPAGHAQNPAKLVLGANTQTVTGAGYVYNWTAEYDGTFTITMDESCDNWTYVINNQTTYAYGENHYSDDEVPVPQETVSVKAGDLIEVVFGTADWSEDTVSFTAEFTHLPGHETNPVAMKIGTNSVKVPADSDGYYYTWTAEKAGVLSFTMKTKKNWSYSITNLTTEDTRTANSSGKATTAGLFVNAGETVSVMVNTNNAKAGSISFTTSFYSTELSSTTGKTLTLKFVHPETGKTITGSKVKWEIVNVWCENAHWFDQDMSEYEDGIDPKYFSAYGSVSKGKLKTYKNGDKVYMTVIGTYKDEVVPYYIELTPAANLLAVDRLELDYVDEEGNEDYSYYVVYGTQLLDLYGKTMADDACLIFSAYSYPHNANQNINWKSSDTKVAKVVKDEIDGMPVVKVYPVWNSQGGYKAGTATITGTAADGSGKKVSIKVEMASLSRGINITHKSIGDAFGDGTKTIFVKPGQKLTLKANLDKGSKGGVQWYVSGVTAGSKVSKGTVTISKNAFNGEFIYVEAYYPQTNVWDQVCLIVQTKTQPACVELLEPYDWNGQMYWDFVQGTKYVGVNESDPVVMIRSFVRASKAGQYANQNVTWSLDKNGQKIADLDTSKIAVYDEDGYSSIWSREDMSEEDWYQKEWYPVAIVTPKTDADGNYMTGVVKLTGTASGGKIKKTATISFINLVNEMEIVTANGQNMTDGYISATAGQKLALTVNTNDNASSKAVDWSTNSPYASISSKGVLTISKAIPSDGISFTVTAYAQYGVGVEYEDGWIRPISAEIEVRVKPLATNVHARADFGEGMKYITNSTQTVDLTTLDACYHEDGSKMIKLSALVYPFEASQKVNWTLGKNNWKYASIYTDEEGSSYLKFNGKPGKVTVTATALDGTKQKASFSLNLTTTMVSMAMPYEMALTGNKTVKLASRISYEPAIVSNKNLSWSMQNIIGWDEDDKAVWSEPTNYIKGVATLNKTTGALKIAKISQPYTLWITVVDSLTGETTESYIDIFPKAVSSITLKNSQGKTIKKGATITAKGDEEAFFFEAGYNTCYDLAGPYYFDVICSDPSIAYVDKYHENENIDGTTYYGPAVIHTGAAGKVKITVKALDGSGKSTYFYVKFLNDFVGET